MPHPALSKLKINRLFGANVVNNLEGAKRSGAAAAHEQRRRAAKTAAENGVTVAGGVEKAEICGQRIEKWPYLSDYGSGNVALIGSGLVSVPCNGGWRLYRGGLLPRRRYTGARRRNAVITASSISSAGEKAAAAKSGGLAALTSRRGCEAINLGMRNTL